MSDLKKSRHKDYEKNRRLKLNEELHANEESNARMRACATAAAGACGAEPSSSTSDDEEEHGDERANKMTILRRTASELQHLAGADEQVYPPLYRGPADMELLAVRNLDACLALKFEVDSGTVISAIGDVLGLVGVPQEQLVGRSLWTFMPEDRQFQSFFRACAAYLQQRRQSDPSVRTVVSFTNAARGRTVTARVDGTLTPGAGAAPTVFTGLVVGVEHEDAVYDAAAAYLTLSLDGRVAGVGPGCEAVFARAETALDGRGLAEMVAPARAGVQPAELQFQALVPLLEGGEVNLEAQNPLPLDGLFHALGPDGPLPPLFSLVVVPLADPYDYDNFRLVGTSLLLLPASPEPALSSGTPFSPASPLSVSQDLLGCGVELDLTAPVSDLLSPVAPEPPLHLLATSPADAPPGPAWPEEAP